VSYAYRSPENALLSFSVTRMRNVFPTDLSVLERVFFLNSDSGYRIELTLAIKEDFIPRGKSIRTNCSRDEAKD